MLYEVITFAFQVEIKPEAAGAAERCELEIVRDAENALFARSGGAARFHFVFERAARGAVRAGRWDPFQFPGVRLVLEIRTDQGADGTDGDTFAAERTVELLAVFRDDRRFVSPELRNNFV